MGATSLVMDNPRPRGVPTSDGRDLVLDIVPSSVVDCEVLALEVGLRMPSPMICSSISLKSRWKVLTMLAISGTSVIAATPRTFSLQMNHHFAWMLIMFPRQMLPTFSVSADSWGSSFLKVSFSAS